MREPAEHFSTPQQVGGTHYISDYGHWHWMAEMQIIAGVGYFEGNATKYVVRWQKKNGKNDLAKALSYVAMLEKEFLDKGLKRLKKVTPKTEKEIMELTTKMASSNNLRSGEMVICLELMLWKTQADIVAVMDKIRELISDAI